MQVQDNSGGTLSYQWKSTDGTIANVNSATTTWTLPNGPGLHFAYVLVNNGLGGLSEGRIAVNTDTIGTKLRKIAPRVLAPPPQAAPQGDFFRAYAAWDARSLDNTVDVAVPAVHAYLQDSVSGSR